MTDTKRWVIKATPGYDPLASRPAPRTPVVVCDIPIGVLTDGAPVYERPRGRAGARRDGSAACRHPDPDRSRARAARARGAARTSARAPGSGGSTTRSSAAAPSSAPGPTRRWCASPAATAGCRSFSRSPSTATAGRASSTRSSAARARSRRSAATWSRTGAEPIGITDCLNFGNPERPEVMDSFARAIDGIAAACKALDVPIVSGNVSLYNETVVQRGGSRPRWRSCRPRRSPPWASCGRPMTSSRRHSSAPATRSSCWARLSRGGRARWAPASGWCASSGRLAGEAPLIDLDAEVRLQKLVLALARVAAPRERS